MKKNEDIFKQPRPGRGGRRPGSGVRADLRQLGFPAEFRIVIPAEDDEDGVFVAVAPPETAPAPPQRMEATDTRRVDIMVTELATCLWYLKTKFLRRGWQDEENSDDDPRVRRLLGRLERGVAALKDAGVEVVDPTNRRYPQGGEHMMRPVQLQPTAGLAFEMVTETATPIVYRDGRLIQRGEVFVAVPVVEPAAVPADSPAPETVAGATAALAVAGTPDTTVKPRRAPRARKAQTTRKDGGHAADDN